MDDIYKIICNLLLIAFGVFIIFYRDSWASLLAKSQKKSPFRPKELIYNEKNDKPYAKRITIGVGISFICAGIILMLK